MATTTRGTMCGRESDPRAFVRCSASLCGPRYNAFDMNTTIPAAGSYTACAKPADP